MKRCTIVLLAACLLVPGTLRAQLAPGLNIFTANANYVTASVEGFSENFNGWGLGFTFEKVLKNNHWSIGANVSYFNVDGQAEGGQLYSFNGLPILLTARYLVGSQRVIGYLGAGAGVQFGSLETAAPVYTRSTTADFVLGTPLGVFLRISGAGFLNLNWTPLWVPDSRLSDGFASVFNVGLSFTFPG